MSGHGEAVSEPRNESGRRVAKLDELRRERLGARIAELEKWIGFQAQKAGDATRWKTCAEASLAEARAALEDGNLQAAWPPCHQAQRFLYTTLSAEQLGDRAKVLRREAEEKLKNWRKGAVLDLIGRDVQQPKRPSPGTLVLAQFLLDEHFGNVYFKLESLASRAVGMIWALGFLVGGVLALAALAGGALPSECFLSSVSQTLVVLALGAVGATLSNTLSALGLTGRIPTVLQGGIEFAVRPLVGAVSAVAVLVVLQAGLIPIEEPKGLALYAWAVGAGFSDQILNRVMNRLEQAAEK